jgi:hypothetical protein
MKTNQLLSMFALSLTGSGIIAGCTEGPEVAPLAELPQLAAQREVKTGWVPGPEKGWMQVTYEQVGTTKILQGDILLTEVYDEKPNFRAALRNGLDWPGAVVPYEIAAGFSAAQQQWILDAVADWNAHTPFYLPPRVNQADYIRFVPSNRCQSPIGHQGGMQDIQLGTGCGTPQTVHEIGHSVGFYHEQSRQDRDNYINIDYSNVLDNQKYNFDKYNPADGYDFGPYDYSSIMHYPSLITDPAFVKDTTKPTITRKDGTTYVTSNRLSALDRAGAWRKWPLSDAIKQRWQQNLWMGFPLDGELPTADARGRFLPTQAGRIYSHPSTGTGAFLVYGAIGAHYGSLGWDASFLGLPVTDETGTPDGKGRYNHFQGGSIYWSPQTGAFEVHGAIRGKWASLGWEKSFLGYPVTDETGTPDGIGRYNHFQGGSIYWTAQTGAFEVHGAIRDKWASLGWEKSPLRYPVTDETGTPDGKGRYNHFQYGSIYWTSSTGAHPVTGFIRDKWASLGWEKSCLGYPTADAQSNFTQTGHYLGTSQQFQHGTITYHDSAISTTYSCN